MISPEIYHFSEYDYLQALLIDPTSRSTLLPELDLSNKEHTDIPPPHVLICFSNLRSLTLSHNQIARFSAIKLLQGIPLLEKLDLSHNSISTLDDLTELGISKSLRSLNIIGNPIAKKYPRIRLVEFLLFPNKNKTYNPIEVLTATYNMASSNVEATRKHEIIVNRIPGTSKSKKGAYVVEDGQGKSAKLTQEMCPLPRNTRFPIMGIFNEEIISIRDIQTILVKKDISSVLFEKEESKGPKLFASEKLHLKYIEGYTRRKNRRKERIDLIPSLERLSQMIRSDDNMKLLYNQDKIRYDKLKLKKPDYEQELWNGPLDLQVDDGDFTIGITQLKQADKVLNEKKEAKKKYEKEHPRALKSYDDPNRQKALRKVEKMSQKEKNSGKGSEKTIPTSSEESSIPEQQSGNIKKSISFTEDESEEGSDEVEIENEEEIEDEESPVKVAPEKMALMRRSMSLPKYNKESIKNKQVVFDKEEGGKDEESIMASTAPLFKVRRTNSESMGFGTRAKTPGLVLEGLMRRSSAEKIDENVTSTRPVTQTNKRFVVVQDSVPNVGLPIYATNTKPKHVRSASVQPVIRKMSKDSIQLFEGIKIHSGREGMATERMPFFSEQEKGITITEKNKRMESRRNSQNSGNTLGLPYLECSKIKDENSLEQPFFSSNQGFNSMRSDLESEPREKIVIDDDYGNKNLIPDRAVDSCRGSAINSANSSMYRINFQSGLENAPSVSIAVNSFRRRDEDKNSSQVNQEGPLKLPKDELEHKTMEKEGFSRPNTTKSAFDLYNEIQGSLALNKLQVKVRPVKDRKPENENGTLKISNVVGNPENGNKGHSRTRSSITISSVQQKDKQMSHRDKKVGQRIMIQELVSNLSPQTSFLSSRLSKNNNHSLAYLRKLRTFGNNLTNRNLAIQGEQIEEGNFPEKVKMLKIGSKEEGGLDSTTAFSSRDKFKSRSSSVENFKSPSGIQIVNNQTDKKKIRSVRLKQAL